LSAAKKSREEGFGDREKERTYKELDLLADAGDKG